MDNKSRPFSSLSTAQREAILSRAHDQRAEAIAGAFRRLGRLLAAPFGRRVGGPKTAPLPAAVSGRTIR